MARHRKREKKGEVLMWFMQHIDADKIFSEAYVSTASSCIGNHLLSQFAQERLKDIDKPLLYKLLYIRMQGDYALSTIKGVLSVLKTAFTRAKERGLTASNPLGKITLKSFTTTQPKIRPGNLKPTICPSSSRPSINKSNKSVFSL